MFRDEMEAALARAEAAERELAELQAKDDSSQAQIEALRQEVERLKRSGGREVPKQRPAPSVPAPSAPEERAWRVAQVAGALYGAVALVYLATMVWLVVGSAAPAAPWAWLRSEGLSDGPLGAFAGWGLGLGLLAFFLCIPVVMSFHAYCETRPDIEMDTSNLIVLLIVTGPLWAIAAVYYAVKLLRHGRRARWLAVLLLFAAVAITVLAGTFWLFHFGDAT